MPIRSAVGENKTMIKLALGVIFASMTTMASMAAFAAPQAMEFTGRGTQIYSCQRTSAGYGWVLKGPDAHMYDADGKAVARHYFGPRWEANDGSTIKGTVMEANASPQADHHNAPWLILRTVVEQGRGIFGHVNMVTRIDTQGGAAPTATCEDSKTDQTIAVPYTAKYTFFSTAELAEK
jgi:hypothetical protein